MSNPGGIQVFQKAISMDEFKGMKWFMDMDGDRHELSELKNVGTGYYATNGVWKKEGFHADVGGKVQIRESVYEKLKAYLDAQTIM